MCKLDFMIRKGTEEEKQDILERFPQTRSVIRKGGTLITALRGDEIIGFLWMYKRKIPAPIQRDEWFINVVEVTDSGCRCKGVGSGLVREAMRCAKEDGVYQISAYCDISNVSSHMLWIKNGFSVLPVRQADGSVPGSFVGFVF